MAAKKQHQTHTQLARLLGIRERYYRELRKRGLPQPKSRENLEQWSLRARGWIAENVVQVNRRSPDEDVTDPNSQAYWDIAWRRARAMREQLALQRDRRNIHDRAECERDTIQRIADLSAALQAIPPRIGRDCADLPAEDVARVAETIIRSALAEFVRDEQARLEEPAECLVGGPAAGAAMADKVVAE